MGDRQDYSTATEGGAPVCMRFLIEGRLPHDRFAGFVLDRAAWLDLRGWVQVQLDGAVEVVAAGPEALVGALEMACTLGPIDAIVERIEASATAPITASGFSLRQK